MDYHYINAKDDNFLMSEEERKDIKIFVQKNVTLNLFLLRKKYY